MPRLSPAKAMGIIGNLLKGDKQVVSGESGTATLGCVTEIIINERLKWMKEKLKLDEFLRIILLST